MPTETVPCPVCREPILPGASKCKHCHEIIRSQGRLGFKGKTLWDFLGLLIVPLSIALFGLVFAAYQDNRQSEIESDRARANMLQAYMNDMSAIILNEELNDPYALNMIQARTAATMRDLDGRRNATILVFLYQTELNEVPLLNQLDLPPFDLAETDLDGVILRGAKLWDADLRGASLNTADLGCARLLNADLSQADLRGASLAGADLFGVDLSKADLRPNDVGNSANLQDAQLLAADLRGANLSYVHMPGADFGEATLEWASMAGSGLYGADLSGTVLERVDLTGAHYDLHTQWPEGFNPTAAGAVLEEEWQDKLPELCR